MPSPAPQSGKVAQLLPPPKLLLVRQMQQQVNFVSAFAAGGSGGAQTFYSQLWGQSGSPWAPISRLADWSWAGYMGALQSSGPWAALWGLDAALS